MAHELDSTNGVVSFANSRTDAWHRLGQSVGRVMTAREALDTAHLSGWNVRKMPLQIKISPEEAILTDDGATSPAPIAVPDQFGTVRDNPIVPGRIDYLGVVGSKYEPVQNEASCTLLDALTEEGGAVYETAGALLAVRRRHDRCTSWVVWLGRGGECGDERKAFGVDAAQRRQPVDPHRNLIRVTLSRRREPFLRVGDVAGQRGSERQIERRQCRVGIGRRRVERNDGGRRQRRNIVCLCHAGEQVRY